MVIATSRFWEVEPAGRVAVTDAPPPLASVPFWTRLMPDVAPAGAAPCTSHVEAAPRAIRTTIVADRRRGFEHPRRSRLLVIRAMRGPARRRGQPRPPAPNRTGRRRGAGGTGAAARCR